LMIEKVRSIAIVFPFGMVRSSALGSAGAYSVRSALRQGCAFSHRPCFWLLNRLNLPAPRRD